MTKMFTIDKNTHRILSRFPRKDSVWAKLGIFLCREDLVFVLPDRVIVQYAS